MHIGNVLIQPELKKAELVLYARVVQFTINAECAVPIWVRVIIAVMVTVSHLDVTKSIM